MRRPRSACRSRPTIEHWSFDGNEESGPLTPTIENELPQISSVRVFTFKELKSATGNFRRSNTLGEGAFGLVYKGLIDEIGPTGAKITAGITVAVKKLHEQSLQGHKEWLAEVIFLGQLHHPHLVKLIGYCSGDEHRLLVYDYMPNGSLENHLFGRATQPLQWAAQMRIALGAAKGLAFLHGAENPIVFRDFKTSNVLLDSDYTAKLSVFGLAKAGPKGDETYVSTRVIGTYGYAAPEYVTTGHLTWRSDVYGFGVVLLELLTGQRSMDTTRAFGKQSLVEWARPYLRDKGELLRIIDPSQEGIYSVEEAQKAAALAFDCLSSNPKARSLMNDAVQILKNLFRI